MNTFLPKDYEVPKSEGNYFKPKQGVNKVRFLSTPIFGYEYWNKDNKPVRLREYPHSIPADARLDDGFSVKHFWALVVWNYAASKLQIWEITQGTIQRQLEDLIHSEDWGDPREYDIAVNRKGEKLTTEYTVQPGKPKPLTSEIAQAYEETDIDLQALFSGGNPMAAEPALDETGRTSEEAEGEYGDINFDDKPEFLKK